MNRLFQPELVKIVDGFESKSDCLAYMADLLARESGCLDLPGAVSGRGESREDIMNPASAKAWPFLTRGSSTVTSIKIAVCLVREPLEFDSVDDLPVQLVFMIAVPQKPAKNMKILARSASRYQGGIARTATP